MRWLSALGILLAVGVLLGACRAAEEEVAAKEPYKIGMAAAITGPVGEQGSAEFEGFRLYFQALNDAGGIDGHPVQVIVEDNRGEAGRAAVQAKKLIETDKVLMIVMNGPSATYAPIQELAEKAGVPLLFGLWICTPKALPPNPSPVEFCAFFGDATKWPPFVIRWIKEQAKGEPIRLATVAMDIPISRLGVDEADKEAQKLGMTLAKRLNIPLGTVDYTPFATEIIKADANWAFVFAPEITTVALFEALQKLGWQGKLLGAFVVTLEEALPRLKAENLLGFQPVASFAENLPEHQRIREAAAKYGAPFPPERLALGWLGAMVVEQALRACGWPCDRAKLREAMNNLEVDTRGLTGGPYKWTPNNHHGTLYYRIYAWDKAAGRIKPASDWIAIKAE